MFAGGMGCSQQLSVSQDKLAATGSAPGSCIRIFKSRCTGSNSRAYQVIFN